MKTKTPQVIIRRNKLLEPMFNAFYREWLQELAKTDPKKSKKLASMPYPTERQMAGRIERYRAYRNADGKKILRAIQQVTGLAYQHNVLEMHVVARTPRELSFPWVIRSRYNRKQFLDLMTEELIHIIYSHNKKKFVKIFEKVQKEFPKGSESFVNHVITFTVLLKVYKKLKMPFRPRFNLPHYKEAFKIAKEKAQ